MIGQEMLLANMETAQALAIEIGKLIHPDWTIVLVAYDEGVAGMFVGNPEFVKTMHKELKIPCAPVVNPNHH